MSTDAIELVALGAALASSTFLRQVEASWFSADNAVLIEWLKKAPDDQRKATNLLDLWLLKHGVERNGGNNAIQDVIAALKLAAELGEARKVAREIAFGTAATRKRKLEMIARLRQFGKDRQ